MLQYPKLGSVVSSSLMDSEKGRVRTKFSHPLWMKWSINSLFIYFQFHCKYFFYIYKSHFQVKYMLYILIRAKSIFRESRVTFYKKWINTIEDAFGGWGIAHAYYIFYSQTRFRSHVYCTTYSTCIFLFVFLFHWLCSTLLLPFNYFFNDGNHLIRSPIEI